MKKIFFVIVAVSITFLGCKKGDLNLFTIDDDKKLGQQTVNEILTNPQEYPVLPKSQYPQQYAYLENMRNEILNSGQIRYKNEFEWQLYIINDPSVQNAFCTPGGNIFVYTGLIKYLDNASSLAGVLGHEMAHADRRHSTTQLTKQYGLQTLLDVVLGNNQNMLTQIASGLINLQFSRDDEKDADAQSVVYLCPTQYRADGAADFFIKISAGGGQQVPAFLSTHPNPDNRVTNIQNKKNELGCSGNPGSTAEITDYSQFKNSLP